MVVLGDYVPLEPVVVRQVEYDALSPDEAWALHELRMGERSNRVVALKAFAARNGIDNIGADDGQRLQGWFVEHFEVDRSAEHPGRHRPTEFWTGFCIDVALWLGEEAIARTGGKLRWDFFDADSKMSGFQQSVLVGFGDHLPDPTFFDVILDVAYGTGGSVSKGRRFQADGWAGKLQVMVAMADPSWRPGLPRPDIVWGQVTKP